MTPHSRILISPLENMPKQRDFRADEHNRCGPVTPEIYFICRKTRSALRKRGKPSESDRLSRSEKRSYEYGYGKQH